LSLVSNHGRSTPLVWLTVDNSVIPSFLEIKESAECGIVTKRIKACYFHFL